MPITTYKIKRDHDNKTGLFCVNDKTNKGFGFQIKIGDYVFGISFWKPIGEIS